MENIKVLYFELKKRISRVEFESLWPNFHEYRFALYTSENVYLEDRIFDVNDKFIGNTSIEFEGNYIAIWNIEDEFKYNKQVDMDLLAANIIHEMFHAFQYENGERRFPNDIKSLDYPIDYENINLKYNENCLLAKACNTKDVEEKASFLAQFYFIRHKRKQLIHDMIQAEYLPETVEGMAEYIGTKALKMISESKYLARRNQYKNILEEISEALFDIRRISYNVGTILMLVAAELGIDFTHKVAIEKRTISELIEERISIVECKEIRENTSIQKISNEKLNSRRNCINDFMSRNPNMYVGDFIICGYDPKNMFKIEKNIFGNHFWILLNRENNEYIRIYGEAVLLVDEGNHVISYWN